jgi:hypothetical protein
MLLWRQADIALTLQNFALARPSPVTYILIILRRYWLTWPYLAIYTAISDYTVIIMIPYTVDFDWRIIAWQYYDARAENNTSFAISRVNISPYQASRLIDTITLFSQRTRGFITISDAGRAIGSRYANAMPSFTRRAAPIACAKEALWISCASTADVTA